MKPPYQLLLVIALIQNLDVLRAKGKRRLHSPWPQKGKKSPKNRFQRLLKERIFIHCCKVNFRVLQDVFN